MRLLSATGSSLQVIGEVTLDIRLCDYVIPQQFLVIRNLHHSGVLGMDMLQACRANINLQDKTLHLFDNLIVTPLTTSKDAGNALCLMQRVRIPARSEAIIPVMLLRPTKHDFRLPAITEPWPSLQQRGVGVARVLVQPESRRTICRVMNVMDTPQTLRRGTKIAYLSAIDTSDPFNIAALNGAQNHDLDSSSPSDNKVQSTGTDPPFEDKQKAVLNTGIKLHSAQEKLTATEFRELVDLLYEYRHLFITDESNIPASTLPPVRIPMLDNKPVRRPPYKLDPELDAQLHAELSKWRKAGILEPTTSVYSSPVFLIKKSPPPGALPGASPSYRLIADMRFLNAHVADQFHVLPTPDQLISKLGHERPRILSCFDNKCGFFSLTLEEGSRDVTAVTSSRSHYRFCRLPLGLKSSSSSYQLSLSTLLADELDGNRCLLYQDDLIIYTQNWIQHKKLMADIFSKYDRARLRFNAIKSQVCKSKVEYLGFTFDETGVRISEDRAKVIQNWPIPQNTRQVRTALGAANYVRRFVPNYSQLTFPLRQLTLQDVKFHWGPEQQQSFDKLKQHLTGDTILVYPNFSNLEKYPFVLLTDGSSRGFGAVLVQKQEDGSERVIQYKARATTRAEAAGSATQLELACLIQALTWFSSLLRLAKFIIRTDHVALTHLKSLKYSSHGKLLRYAILLDSFDYTIEHTKGKQHLLPDALSRRPFSEEEKKEAESSAVELDPLYLTAITDAYFDEIPSTVESRAKSHSRHFRRHAKVLTFAPIQLQDVVEPRTKAQGKTDTMVAEQAPPQLPLPEPTADEIARHAADLPPITLQTQSEDPYFEQIINFLVDNQLPQDKQAARRIVLIAENFEIIEGQLVKLANFRRKRREAYMPLSKQLCVPPQWRLPILTGYHDFLNHANVERTYYSIRQKYFWKNQYADIETFVTACDACQRVRHRKQKPIKVGRTPDFDKFEAVHADHFGELHVPDARHPFRYVLVLCDHRTMYTELVPVKSTGAIETARSLYEKYFLRFGFIPNFISDRAQSFLGAFTQELLKLCQVKSIQTSGFHPQMNSRCEIFNKTLGHSLRTHLLKGQTDWPNRLQAIAFGFNVGQVPTLGVSAYNLVYACQPRLPIDLQLVEAARRSNVPHFVETFFDDFSILNDAISRVVSDNRDVAEKHQFARAREHGFKENDCVYKQEFAHRPGTSAKLLPKFSGPFKIQNLIGQNNARLQDIVTGKILKNLVSLDHLRRAQDRRELIRKYWENQPQQTPSIANSTSTPAETPSQSVSA
jgi:hypothetical protein